MEQKEVEKIFNILADEMDKVVSKVRIELNTLKWTFGEAKKELELIQDEKEV